jgi:hypothetical protein
VGKLPNAGALLPLREGILAHLAERATEDRWTPQRIVHDVRQVMPADGIVALDNGMYKIWFARNYRTRAANTLLLDNALATMGAGLPSAIMAAMLYPKRRVLAVCGDGGFMMNSQEMETAVRRKLDLVVLVLVDSAFGMIRWKQAVDGFADFGMTFGNPDFALYAQAYGAEGHHVTEIGDFAPMLEAAFAAAACTWWRCRSTTRRTSACSSTSCAIASAHSCRHLLPDDLVLHRQRVEPRVDLPAQRRVLRLGDAGDAHADQVAVLGMRPRLHPDGDAIPASSASRRSTARRAASSRSAGLKTLPTAVSGIASMK